MILLGYHPTGGYRLLNPVTKQFAVSRDVVIDEYKNWNWDEPGNSSKRMILDLNDSVEGEVAAAESSDVRRSQRSRQMPSRLLDYEGLPNSAVNSEGDLTHVALLIEAEPISYKEAMQDEKWINAMKEELSAIERNQTWELVSLPN